jgi:hypothetical protein
MSNQCMIFFHSENVAISGVYMLWFGFLMSPKAHVLKSEGTTGRWRKLKDGGLVEGDGSLGVCP